MHIVLWEITYIKKVCNVNNATQLQTFDISIRNRYLKELKEKYSLSIR
ncbi:hypothetical protein SAMN05446037_101627 [Anaerovirgula multivorans]|uniref:Uncharacterized protein n=1 Tax=Anaerovirgula multivorans TaxID=312168 RepID=A0A239GBL0_9FIRM|nr:hypothetical protein SAMN05446037_101627 [Anaerovirgula multivorans]